MRGYDDHGVWFMGEVHKWLKSGALNPAPNITVVRETESSLLLDGDGGCGVAASYQAMRWCVERAAERGIATAGIQRSGHFIAAAPFPTWAAKQGYIAHGRRERGAADAGAGRSLEVAGDQPVLLRGADRAGAPAGLRHGDERHRRLQGPDHGPAGQIGRGRAGLQRRRASPTTDPGDLDRGGSLAPVGGYKGFGLALMVDVLAGVLTGAQFGQNAGVVNGKEGHFFLALNPDIFMPRAEFLSRMDELLAWVKSGEKIEGVGEIVYPGERGQRRAAEITASGQVPLNAVAWRRSTRSAPRTGWHCQPDVVHMLSASGSGGGVIGDTGHGARSVVG